LEIFRMTRITAPLLVLAFVAMAAPGASQPATQQWMTEEAMRVAFIGKTLDGYYADRREFTETYTADGRLQYRESSRRLSGYWYFRGQVFCTIYDPGQDLSGGCFTAVQVSANCYEFYVVSLGDRDTDRDAAPAPTGAWTARASRQGEPSTCEGRPTI
jgi:hypothetical protein